MIPLKLSVKNFLSYRGQAPVLDLEGVHVACLCGDNGHGKSALLDAITWALWGNSRARVQEDLVYQGESDMQVDLEFQAGDGRYRVTRRFAKPVRGRQGSTFLDLFQATGDAYLPISGNSVRETEAHIRSLLRMDYDTFVNTAFILQGKADMFTTSTPAQRKELLGEVLGLSWYERLAEKARERARRRDASARLLEAELGNITAELAHKEEYLADLDRLQAELDNAMKNADGLENSEKALQVELEELQGQSHRLEQLEREERRLLQELQERQGRVSASRTRLENLRETAERLPALESSLVEAHTALQQLAVPSKDTEEKRQRVGEVQARVLFLRQANDALKLEMEELRKKVDLLMEASGPQGAGANCPLCGEALGEEGCQHLAASYEADGKQKAAAHRTNDSSIRDLEAEAATMEQAINRHTEETRVSIGQAERQRDALTRQAEAARASAGLVEQQAEALASEESTLQASHRLLEDVRVAVPPAKEAVADLPRLVAEQQDVKAQLGSLRTRLQQLHRELGETQARLDRSNELELQRGEKTAALAAAAHQKGVFDQLSGAFGKGGIQALLIEQALPELENQANDLLGRLTEHRMNIKLESQRERRGGGEPRETLDIKISDELGTRSYETYSGGEAFRVNFALRIALSRLLAHRSGAPLPTLFIDEGFGTQDAAGLERLVGAIKAIQNDFQKIVVITHIEELKEAFPVRIEVTKTARGSTFTVS